MDEGLAGHWQGRKFTFHRMNAEGEADQDAGDAKIRAHGEGVISSK